MIKAPLTSLPRHAVLLLSLLFLHAVLALGPGSGLGRSLLVAHFGLFLLWQPFLGTRFALPWHYVLLGAILLTALLTLGWWALILWMMLLGAVVGGRLFFDAPLRLRGFYVFAFTDLLGCILLFAIPQAIGALGDLKPILLPLMHGLMPLVLTLLYALTHSSREDAHGVGSIDVVYSLFVLLLIAVLASGSIAVMHIKTASYFAAVLSTVMVTAGLMFSLALVWSPRFGFAGLASLLAQYMFADRLPFEQLLRDLGGLAQSETEPECFLQCVTAQLPHYLGWVAGAEWRLSGAPRQSMGTLKGVPYFFQSQTLSVTLYSRRTVSPTLLWQARLFVQVVAEYCRTLEQARRLKEMSYVEAVHQTGARLTHDVKNLLQSFNALTTLCAETDKSRAGELQLLLQRQLPAISQRLQATLGKLNHPEPDNPGLIEAAAWWRNVCLRFENRGIVFGPEPAANTTLLPSGLFDSAAENLLQNALDKRGSQPDINIQMTLAFAAAPRPGWVLSVSDSGTPVPAPVVQRLGEGIPESENGLGIGLYQLVRQARLGGYDLQLVENVSGEVTFRLLPV